jgi:hypothetical protein
VANVKMEAWNKVFPRGYIAGDTVGNMLVAVHLALAFLAMLGRTLQLIPYIRARVPRFHRWNGRVYISSVFFSSIVGRFMVWGRGSVGSMIQHLEAASQFLQKA